MLILQALPPTLRDTFRGGHITYVMTGLVAVVAGVAVVFSVLGVMGVGQVPTDLWGRVPPGSVLGHFVSVAAWMLAYVFTALVALALFLSFAVMSRVRTSCLAQYRMLVPVAGGSLVAPLRRALRQVGQMLLVMAVLLCVPMLGVVLAPVAAAYCNARGLVGDALESLATDQEVSQVLRSSQADLALLGAFTVAWALIPLVGLTAPLLLTTGTCHVAMRRLAVLRGYQP